MTTRIASFHLAEFPLRRSTSRLISLAAERWELPSTEGCVLGKVLGTSAQNTMKTSVDLRRWAIFAVWEDAGALEGFLHESALLDRWRTQSRTLEHFSLRPLRSRGTWSATDPFPQLQNSSTERQIAVVTRATVRPSRLLTFTKAIAPVDSSLRAQAGCSLALGMGEWPIGQQATFSIWDSDQAMQDFAHNGQAHSDAIRRTYKENWYSEELFARFEVVDRHKEGSARKH